MTKREKVIRGLECCMVGDGRSPKCEICPYATVGDDTCQTMDALFSDALVLLKAQEPVEPKLDVDEWRCGNCGHKLEHQELLGDNVLFHEQYNYCPNCGKAVKLE